MTSNNGWSVVPLGEVLFHRKEFVRIDDLATYKRCRVQLHAKGVVLRDEVEGAVIKTKTQQVCRTDELLVAEIDAKVGGYGLVPQELDGAIVSSHYFLFPTNRDRLEPRFLDYFVRTPTFRDQVSARGSTNYAAIRPHHVLAYKIPLPPLPEQRRIVAKIERLAAKIDDAHSFRQGSSGDLDAYCAAACRSIFSDTGWPSKSIQQQIGRDALRNGKSIKSIESVSGIRCLRLSAVCNGRINLADSKSVPLSRHDAQNYLIQEQDVFVMRGNGSKQLVGQAARAESTDGRTIFPDLLIRIPLQDSGWTPDYFVAYWNSPIMRRKIEDAAKTTSGIWKINQGHIANMEIPTPPLAEQRRIVAYLDGLQAKVDELKRLQTDSATQLDALLPAILDRAFKGEL